MRASITKKDDPRQAAKAKFVWLRQVFSDPATGHLACRIAGLMVDHVNRATGEAWPSQGRLAEAAGVTTRAVQYALQGLISEGHLEVRRKRGCANRYRPLLKDANAHSLDSTRPAKLGSETGEPNFARLQETPLRKPLSEAERQHFGREMVALAKQLGGRAPRSSRDA